VDIGIYLLFLVTCYTLGHLTGVWMMRKLLQIILWEWHRHISDKNMAVRARISKHGRFRNPKTKWCWIVCDLILVTRVNLILVFRWGCHVLPAPQLLPPIQKVCSW